MLVRIPPEQRRPNAVLDPEYPARLRAADRRPAGWAAPTGAVAGLSGTGPEAARPSASANACGG